MYGLGGFDPQTVKIGGRWYVVVTCMYRLGCVECFLTAFLAQDKALSAAQKKEICPAAAVFAFKPLGVLGLPTPHW